MLLELMLLVDNIFKEEINIHPITEVDEQHEEDSRDYRDHKTFKKKRIKFRCLQNNITSDCMLLTLS